jgi:hypothetical protein
MYVATRLDRYERNGYRSREEANVNKGRYLIQEAKEKTSRVENRKDRRLLEIVRGIGRGLYPLVCVEQTTRGSVEA